MEALTARKALQDVIFKAWQHVIEIYLETFKTSNPERLKQALQALPMARQDDIPENLKAILKDDSVAFMRILNRHGFVVIPKSSVEAQLKVGDEIVLSTNAGIGKVRSLIRKQGL